MFLGNAFKTGLPEYQGYFRMSPTQEDLAAALNIPYDPSKTVIPTLAQSSFAVMPR